MSQAADPAAISAAQLIYSNVEAEDSPTRRRGFQVWLWSPRLTEFRREIACRLDDYEPPHTGNDFATVTRLSFFPLTDTNDFVVAKTVPIKKTDVGKREGRFHAHAVVIPAREFALIHNDPFWILDRFPFETEPTDAGKRIARLLDPNERGLLPDETSIAVARPNVEPDDPALKAAFPLLVRWLNGKEDPRPVAIPAAPERVTRFLRGLFRFLPPELRAKASFDTLSTGQSLDQIPFRFVGATDLPTLRHWMYRRSYRLDVATGKFGIEPDLPPDAGLDHLAAGWADPEVEDQDRRGSWKLLTALREPKGTIPATLTNRAITLVQNAPTVEAGFLWRAENRFVEALPSAALRDLIKPELKAWLGKLAPEGVQKLAQPIPLSVIADWLFAKCEPITDPLAVAIARELTEWTKTRINEKSLDAATRKSLLKLHLIGLWWQPNTARRLEQIRIQEGGSHLFHTWFRAWAGRRTPAARWLESETSTRETTEQLFGNSSRGNSREAADDLEKYLSLGKMEEAAPLRQLHFAIAFQRADDKEMSSILAAEIQDAAFIQWVFERSKRAGLYFEGRFIKNDGIICPGVTACTSATDPTNKLMVFLRACIEQKSLHRTIIECGVKQLLEGCREDDGHDDLVSAQREFDLLRSMNLTVVLGGLSTEAFRRFMYHRLKGKFYTPLLTKETDEGMWFGPRPQPIAHNPDTVWLWDQIIEAIRKVPENSNVRAAALVAALLQLKSEC